jgi:hypothetical protein
MQLGLILENNKYVYIQSRPHKNLSIRILDLITDEEKLSYTMMNISRDKTLKWLRNHNSEIFKFARTFYNKEDNADIPID